MLSQQTSHSGGSLQNARPAHVQAIVGFSWGFTISNDDITLAPPKVLEPGAWDSHLDLLRTSYPDWIFDSGYLSG